MKIPPFKLTAIPLSEEAASLRRSEWLDPVIGTRHKIGGEPDLVYDQEFPDCSCGKAMTFYAQLDSLNDDIMFADAGLVYVFVCFDCFETRSFLQSY